MPCQSFTVQDMQQQTIRNLEVELNQVTLMLCALVKAYGVEIFRGTEVALRGKAWWEEHLARDKARAEEERRQEELRIEKEKHLEEERRAVKKAYDLLKSHLSPEELETIFARTKS